MGSAPVAGLTRGVGSIDKDRVAARGLNHQLARVKTRGDNSTCRLCRDEECAACGIDAAWGQDEVAKAVVSDVVGEI